MKKIITLFFAVICIAASSQNVPLALRMDLVTWVKFEPKDYLTGGKVGLLEIKVRNYDVYQDSISNQYYIYVANNMKRKKKVDIGYKHGGIQEYMGNTIFFNKDTTKCWMWTVDRYGQITKMNLPDYFATDVRVIK